MVNILSGNTLSAFMLWVQLSQLFKAWLLWSLAGMLFFSFCQPARDLKKVVEKVKWGSQANKDDSKDISKEINWKRNFHYQRGLFPLRAEWSTESVKILYEYKTNH